MNTPRFAYLAAMLITAACLPPVHAETIEWTRLFGTSSAYGDSSKGVSADGNGNVYTSGRTGNDSPPFIGEEAFVNKYDAGGTLVWTRQLGTDSLDRSTGVSADQLGNVFISGYTEGDFDGTIAGKGDAFVSKYDEDGTLAWTRQFGTSSHDESSGVSADGLGNVFVSGWTLGTLDGISSGDTDAFVRKYNTDGDVVWTRQFGTSTRDYAWGISADKNGNVYVSGSTSGALDGIYAGGSDAFVKKYDSDGNLIWTEQLGTSDSEISFGISADRLGNVFISGQTRGDLGGINAGDLDAFVSKYDADGNLDWTRQLGTAESDASYGVSADGLGNVFISGGTTGSLDGTSAGNRDAFVVKYDIEGNLVWTRQIGTPEWDESFDVSADGLGNIFLSGWTVGNLNGDNAGFEDAFVIKINDLSIPEPSSALLLFTVMATLTSRRHFRH